MDTPVQYLKGIGPKRAKYLNKIGVNSVEDLLYYFPRRYEDRSKFLSISGLKEGEFQTIKARVLAKGQRQSWKRRRFSILELAVGDDTGKIFCVWFNQPFLSDYFKTGSILILYGKVECYGARLQMNSPEFEVITGDGDESLNTARIVPIYTLAQGFSQRSFRQIIKHTLDEYLPAANDTLPYDIRNRNNLLNLAKSLMNIHFPETLAMQKDSYRRLAFEEFFLFQVPMALRKLKKKDRPGIEHKTEGGLLDRFIARLPFKLTDSQNKVIQEIKLDMGRMQSMQRLLQGDVGSGKTVVATIASIIAIQGGYQVSFIAPTEILAKQHFEKIRAQEKEIKVGLLTSSFTKKEKDKIYKEIKEGNINLIIGTHALLEERLEFKNLGLVVID
ncbi:MAG TPA: DEAD/DEAH box helicase, partial [Candidatus Omnitrophota bacterium]|nr:DEAD/DEAH box helicase [Candidatus Omnitrophota bacterium]